MASLQPDTARVGSRLLYPTLASQLSPAELHRIFGPTYQEQEWARRLARTSASQIGLVLQLKVFQAVGRFLSMTEVPTAGIEHVAHTLGVAWEPGAVYARATRYRHQAAVREYLGVSAWGPAARQHARSTMIGVAKTRTNPTDLVNATVDALVRQRFELPALTALRRIAGSVHRAVNAQQWRDVCSRLDLQQRSTLEELLKVTPPAQESPFAQLRRAPGRPSRKNLNALIARYKWLQGLPDPTAALHCVADSKVLQWANEARRLKAPELRAYVGPRRLTLLLALIRQSLGQVLDDLMHMLLRIARKVQWKSEQRLEEFLAQRRAETDALIRTFHDSLLVHSSDADPREKLARLEALFDARSGRAALEHQCAQHLRLARQTWRVFARGAFESLRSPLLRIAELLPLQATPASLDLLRMVCAVTDDGPPYYDYTTIVAFNPQSLPGPWRALVQDHPHGDSGAFNRRQLEVLAMLELAAAIKAGDLFVAGSLSYQRFWDRLPNKSADPTAMTAYAASRGWGESPNGLAQAVKEALSRQTSILQRALYDKREGYLRRGKDGRPTLCRVGAAPIPASALGLERLLAQRLPVRQVLDCLANADCWTRWSRHFGPPSRSGPQIRNAGMRYVFTAFAYGCGLGPTQAARHLQGRVSADQLSFADRRHIDIDDLRAASADLIDVYGRFELPLQWGTGASASADGTHFETYEDNLLAEHHIRYGKTGGIAYRHIADNYIALFSRFIACGTYEATYILDALVRNLSALHPRRVHADTHGQSAAVFGLAYLLGIELMPRIRRWRELKFYSVDRNANQDGIAAMFSGSINWRLIEEFTPLFLQLALAIHSNALAPSAVLTQINSYSSGNRFARALLELGRAVRTTYLLQWVEDESLRRAVHKGTTKVERHHRFAKHLNFGGAGHLRTNNPADQQKAVVYNELVANAVALQNVVDQTQALHALKREGVPVDVADLAFLSPYGTSHLKRFGDTQRASRRSRCQLRWGCLDGRTHPTDRGYEYF
jgi:TnpA family transposase